MIYTPKIRKAMQICYAAHSGQFDKAGAPYVFHPIHLAEQMTDEISCIVALLHDVVEDGACTIDDLIVHGFDDSVIESIKLLTHDKQVPYMDYIAALKCHPIARTVKLADLLHNSNLTRLDASQIDAKALHRVEKYKKAIDLLQM